MKQRIFPVSIALISLLLTSCSAEKQQSEPAENEISDSSLFVDTTEEIRVYNDFIDQVYRIEYCHLEMSSPREYLRMNDHRKISDQEISSYTEAWNKYMKKYYEMLDTSIIIAFVSDSLYSLELPNAEYFDQTDSALYSKIKLLVKDTSNLRSAYFILDSLKSKTIFFERPPYKNVDWENMPEDTAMKYSDQNYKSWYSRVGKQIDNKYYIGSISMSRVKFNQDSTFCVLECGYTAQIKCGYGHYYFLEKKNNKWEIVIKLESWVS